MLRTFYRIVRTDPPILDDMKSRFMLGYPPPDRLTPEERRWWDGISVFASEHQAREQARRFPRLGRFIATIEVPDNELLTFERTGERPGHYTLWGPAETLAQCVVHMARVDG